MKINISDIISKFASLDSSGKDSQKIDTCLEFYKLGEYLNGSGSKKDENNFEQLNKSQQSLLITIYNEAKQFITEKFLNKDCGVEITEENLNEYLKVYNSLMQNNYKTDESSQKLYNAIAKGLYNYCQKCEYDLSDTDSDYKVLDYNYIFRSIADRDKAEAEMRAKGQAVIDRLKNPYDNNLLKSAVEKRICEENIGPLNPDKYSSDIGNGKYDKPAKQKTELCWAHAGINALLTTEEGISLLNSSKYYDKRTGVFAIHIQEAEDNGLHGGIYVITPEEIESKGKNLSSGEGDITVWMIALKRYFDEMSQNPELMKMAEEKGQVIRDVDSGNAQFRFFEIITGAKPVRKDLWNETRLQTGVYYGKNDITFNDIADLVINKKGAAVVCIGGHTMSIVGVKNDKLLIQESNFSEDLGDEFRDDTNNHILFTKTEPINGVPTYELSKYDFEHYNFGEGIIKWG